MNPYFPLNNICEHMDDTVNTLKKKCSKAAEDKDFKNTTIWKP